MKYGDHEQYIHYLLNSILSRLWPTSARDWEWNQAVQLSSQVVPQFPRSRQSFHPWTSSHNSHSSGQTGGGEYYFNIANRKSLEITMINNVLFPVSGSWPGYRHPLCVPLVFAVHGVPPHPWPHPGRVHSPCPTLSSLRLYQGRTTKRKYHCVNIPGTGCTIFASLMSLLVGSSQAPYTVSTVLSVVKNVKSLTLVSPARRGGGLGHPPDARYYY